MFKHSDVKKFISVIAPTGGSLIALPVYDEVASFSFLLNGEVHVVTASSSGYGLLCFDANGFPERLENLLELACTIFNGHPLEEAHVAKAFQALG
jgi:hypothetical protein